MDLTAEMGQLNQYIRAHRYGLKYTAPERMPENPILWLGTRLVPDEFKLILGVLLLLFKRGVTPEEFADYALDRTVALPFEGSERRRVDAMLADMSNRGLSALAIVRIVEMSGIMVDGYVRLGILHTIAQSTEYEQAIHGR